jgi:glutathione S-transferase
MTMTLFYAANSCSLASHLALAHSGATYSARKVDFTKSEQRTPEYLAVNPKGRVPALVTERGIITENPAILAYVAQRFPAAKLLPVDDVYLFAQAQSFNSYLASTVHVAHAHRYRGARWSDDPAAHESMRRKVPETMTACFQQIESDYFQGPFVLGDQYSACDMYVFTISQWLEGDEVDVNQFAKVSALRKWMFANPVVQQVLQSQ